MSLILPIPEYLGGRRQPPRPGAVRAVPEPKAFVLPVTWKETVATPDSVPLLINPVAAEPHRRQTITRRKIPLALRLGPTL